MEDGGWGETYKVRHRELWHCRREEKLILSIWVTMSTTVVRNGRLYKCGKVTGGTDGLGDHHTAACKVSQEGTASRSAVKVIMDRHWPMARGRKNRSRASSTGMSHCRRACGA